MKKQGIFNDNSLFLAQMITYEHAKKYSNKKMAMYVVGYCFQRYTMEKERIFCPGAFHMDFFDALTDHWDNSAKTEKEVSQLAHEIIKELESII